MNGESRTEPTYRGQTADQLPSGWLTQVIDGLYAYDTGSVDSGIHDEELRTFVRAVVGAMGTDERRARLSEVMRKLFFDFDAIIQGYGWEDARALADWYDDQFGVG